MDWQETKELLYFNDGSWRDIYVLKTSKEDWQKWIGYCNTNYSLKFYNGKLDTIEHRIDAGVVFDFWNSKIDTTSNSTIEIKNIVFNCHFFNHEELEIDFDPIQITSIEHHQIVLDLMLSMSQLLAKPVILTLENTPIEPLITVYKNEVIIKNPKS